MFDLLFTLIPSALFCILLVFAIYSLYSFSMHNDDVIADNYIVKDTETTVKSSKIISNKLFLQINGELSWFRCDLITNIKIIKNVNDTFYVNSFYGQGFGFQTGPFETLEKAQLYLISFMDEISKNTK